MGALDPEGYAFVNNGGGTLADPVHVYPYSAVAESKDPKTGVITPATPARTLTVRQSDVASHIREVVEAAVLHNKKANVKASEEAIAEARQWYVTAHDKAVKMQEAFNKEYPDAHLSIQQVTGVIAAVSPRQGWDQNIVSARKVLTAYLTNTTSTLDDLKDETGAGLRDNVAIALKILDGAGPEVMTGTKRQSFWNNLMDPANAYDVTIDGWMASSIWRMGGTYSDGSPVDEKALAWIDHDFTLRKQKVVKGAGYIIVADAVRDVARDLQMTPSEVQAVYWVAVGGGQLNTQMWSNEPKRTGPLPGYNAKGAPAWTQMGVAFNNPFSRYLLKGSTSEKPLYSPLTDTRWHRYGHFYIVEKFGPDGRRIWQVRDPLDVNAKAGLGTYKEFKTKKAATDFMDGKYPDGPPVEPVRVGPVKTQGIEEVMQALRNLPAGHPFAVTASGSVPGIALDDDGGEWSDPTDYDAVAISDMAHIFRSTKGYIDGIRSAWEMSGPHPTAGQIVWCWENPDAWALVDVDRGWFAEQVAARVIDPPLPV